jgi:hypothetical protein
MAKKEEKRKHFLPIKEYVKFIQQLNKKNNSHCNDFYNKRDQIRRYQIQPLLMEVKIQEKKRKENSKLNDEAK